jgi:diguanylate cyclase (GGDEF)-like protein
MAPIRHPVRPLFRPLTAVPAALAAGRRTVALVAVVRAAMVAGLVAYTAHSLTGASAGAGFFEDWLYNGLLVVAGLLVVLRGALVARERAAWLVLGAGLTAWSAGVVVATVRPELTGGSFPAAIDLLWLAYYPAAYAALVLFVRARVKRFYVSLWVDGLVGALALSALVSALVFPALVAGTADQGGNLLADISYPVADVLLAGFVLRVGALTQWRPGRVLGLVAVAMLAGALVDCWSLWTQLTGETALQTRLDWLWPASAVVLAVAAWVPHGRAGVIRLSGLRPLAPPVVFAGSALGLLLISRVVRVDATGFLLASATLAAVIARMALTFAENLRMVDRSERDAHTDPLTGLGNRRRLLADLDEVQRAASAADPWALIEFDLDGFKRFNDTYGHPAGDELLSILGSRLAAAAGTGGTAYRLGGDEFCVLVRLDGREPDALVRHLTPALCRRGPAFDVTASAGAVALPTETADASAALSIADDRLYAAKRARRADADPRVALELLRAVVRRQDPGLGAHAERVAALAARVGDRLGLVPGTVDERVLAVCDAHLRGAPTGPLSTDLVAALRAEATAPSNHLPEVKAA